MKNENRAVFDRAPERCDFAFELPLASAGTSNEDDAVASEPQASHSGLIRFFAFIAKTLRRRHNRMALLELSDDQLKDIGISRSQAYGDYSRYRRSNAHGLERKCL